MSEDLGRCSGCGCVTDGRCHVDVAGFTCGQHLCDDCTHVDQRYGWTHEPKSALVMINDLVKRLRNGCIYYEADLSWCADVNETNTDALCYEAADMIEELEGIVAQKGRVIDEMEKQNEN